MKAIATLTVLSLLLGSTAISAEQLPQLGDQIQDFSVEEFADLYELNYGEIESLTFEVSFPPSKSSTGLYPLIEDSIVAGSKMPESTLSKIAEAEANPSTTQVRLEIPVPLKKIRQRDGSLDAYLGALVMPLIPISAEDNTLKGISTTQSGSGSGSCSHAGNQYPNGTKLTMTTCGDNANISYGLTCMNGVWVVDFLQDFGSICP